MSAEPPAQAASQQPVPLTPPTPPPTPQSVAAEPWTQAGPPPAPASVRIIDELRALAVTALLGLALAFPVGALWRYNAPAVQAVFEPASSGGSYYAAPEGKSFIGVDGWFAFLAMGAAILLAALAFVLFRRGSALGAVLGLGAGGLGGGYLAAKFGAVLGPGSGSAARAAAGVRPNAVFDMPLMLRATGAVWLWPAVAVGLFFILMLLFGPLDPYPEDEAYSGEDDPAQAQVVQQQAQSQSPAEQPGAGTGPAPAANGLAGANSLADTNSAVDGDGDVDGDGAGDGETEGEAAADSAAQQSQDEAAQ